MMKKIIIFSFFLGVFFGCEEVIDVDVPESEPRLVIDANIQWEKGTTGNQQSILLSLSTPFFEEDFVPVTDAVVSIENLNSGAIFPFTHLGGGEYTTSVFVPVLYDTYQLNILYENENYQAIEDMIPVTEISRIEQTYVDGISEDGQEVNIEVFTDDIPDVANFFLIGYQFMDELPNLIVYDDEFQDGNEIGFNYRRGFFDLDTFVTGDVVSLDYQGISSRFFEYMNILLEQSTDIGDPFATIPVALNGNGVNLTNEDNKPFGFFRLGEVEFREIVIE